MSLSRLALITFAAFITTISVNPRTFAADSSVSATSTAAPTLPAPGGGDGTIVGDD